MNLLIKKTGLFLFLTALFLYACDDTSELELDPGEEGNKIGTFVEIFPVETAIKISDSIKTSRVGNVNNYILAGKHEDEYSTTYATGFTQVGATKTTLTGNPVFVSFDLQLDFDYGFGNSIQAQQILVYQLEKFIDSSKTYFSRVDDPYEGFDESNLTLLNTVDQYVSIPSSDRGKVKIKLDELDEVGNDFLAKLVANDPILTDPQKFDLFFKGLAIKGGNSNTAILGADPDSSMLILNYKETNADTAKIKQVSFPLSYPSFQYNQVKSEIKNLDVGIVQSSSGVTTRISFPALATLIDKGKKVAINKADIIIEPTSLSTTPPPSNIYLFNLKQEDSVATVKDLVYPANFKAVQLTGRGIEQVLNSSALSLPYNSETKSYVGNITSYITSIIEQYNTGLSPFELLIYPEAPGSMVNTRFAYTPVSGGATLTKDMTVNRAVIEKEKIKIKIYYTLVP